MNSLFAGCNQENWDTGRESLTCRAFGSTQLPILCLAFFSQRGLAFSDNIAQISVIDTSQEKNCRR